MEGNDEAARLRRSQQWTEVRLRGLEPHEHDSQEFKSSLFICTPTGIIRADFMDNLSKQISAFANAGGGNLFLGINDKGRIDGGIPTRLRPNGTREWLEDVIRAVVDPAVKEYNVYEVPATNLEASEILPDHAVYVLEIPESEDAPHQARDHRYYLRIAGKSRPMSHRHVLDVMNRSRDPKVILERVDPYGEPELHEADPRGPIVLLRLRGTLANRGRALAKHVGCEFVLPRYAVTTESRRRILAANPGVNLSQSPGEMTFSFYHPTPVFPQQELSFGEVTIPVHTANLLHYTGGRVVLRWRVYADAAPYEEGQVDLSAFAAVKRAIRMVRREESTRSPTVDG